ncbi:MAG: thymidine kinase [Phycisphaerae bacterium]|nr:thymidine kinase [Phycisphaerae bacterium]
MVTVTDRAMRRGRIELICGCMFSGKSERLIRRVEQAGAVGVSVVAFKHACDDRYGADQIVAHSGLRVAAYRAASAVEILRRVGEARLVVIDEAQFFTADLVDACRQLAAEGRQVVVGGLDRDSWGLPFGPMPELEAIADEVTRTRAVCARCGRPAEYTCRRVPVAGLTMVGGAEAYEPRCRDCFEAPPIELRR